MEWLVQFVVEVCRQEDIRGVLGRTRYVGCIQNPLEDRLLMLLWFLASLGKYSSIADCVGVSESTACDNVRSLITFIHDYTRDWVIKWPLPDELEEIKDMYCQLHNFPDVGMIDGTHVTIKKSRDRGIDFYNRKDY